MRSGSTSGALRSLWRRPCAASSEKNSATPADISRQDNAPKRLFHAYRRGPIGWRKQELETTRVTMKRGYAAPQRVLVVCSGNTCRSPMAEALLRRLIGADSDVQSAGTDAADGLPPSKDAVSVMKELGLDISTHRSRNIKSLDLSTFQLIVAMTRSIAEKLQQAGVNLARMVQLEVKDPIGNGIDVYRSTRDEIDRQLHSHIARIFGKATNAFEKDLQG